MYKRNSVILILPVVIFLITGCMTSRGNLFTDTVNPAAEDDQTTEPPPMEQGLTIETYPGDSDIYINSVYSGRSPVTVQLESGNYRITVEKEGFHTTTEWVNFNEGDSVSIEIELEPITGTLQIKTDLENIEITTPWDTLYPGTNELRIGKYRVEARLFGYEPWEKSVEIFENRTTRLTIEMVPEVFRISYLFPGRKIFNPENPAGLGVTNISFEVSTYGTGELEIFTENGNSILKHNFNTFIKTDQNYSWNGKDGYGKALPDGNYRVVVSGRDREGKNSSQGETWVSLDSSLIIRVRNIYSGLSGTMFSPTPDILPRGSFQLTLAGAGHIEAATGYYRFPVSIGTRWIPAEDLEIDAQLGVFIQEPAPESNIFSIGLKKPFLNTGNPITFKAAGTIKAAYLYNSYTDTLTNFTGLTGGIAVSLSAGPLSLILAPEIILSPFYVSYTETPPLGFYLWGYARGALQLDLGSTMIALSAAVRSKPFREGFSLDYPFSAGAEIHWLIPGTGVFITGMVSGEFSSMDKYYINAGGGIGIIN